MITVTPQAAAQVRKSAEQAGEGPIHLRLAARLDAKGVLEYGMGLDAKTDDDQETISEGISVLISPGSVDLLTGATLDFVEINPGEFQFIFVNPNDPSHKAPATDGPVRGGQEPGARG